MTDELDISALPVREEAARGWQPIDTAPKDGTEVLLFAVGYITPFVGNYVDFKGAAPAGYRDGWCNAWNGAYLDEDPTHWQPLPDPPSALLVVPGREQETKEEDPLSRSDSTG